MKSLPLVTAMLLLAALLHAQPDISVADYIAGQVGDTLAFENLSRSDSSLHVIVYETSTLAASRVRESNGEERVIGVNEHGWQLFSLRIGDQDFSLPRPITLLPAQATRSRTYRQNVAVPSGKLTFETVLLGFEAAKTPLRNFVNCLKIRQTISLKTPIGKLTQERIAWYAREIGPVKFIKKTRHASEQTTVAALLQSAIIGGKPLAGRRRN